MKKKIVLRAMTATLILASSAKFALYAQTAQPYQGVVGRTLAESKEWWPEPLKAPAGAPNVVWILIDDAGFGASATFGGLIQTPTFDDLANHGLRYTNFHTAAICAPTRAALLTGRNSASVHESGFSHISASAGFPGWDGRVPATAGNIAEILRDNGYNAFAVGKYGITPDEEATDAGPFDHWPTGKGFDHFFGFLGSATDQSKPDLVEDQAHATPDGRHLSDQIVGLFGPPPTSSSFSLPTPTYYDLKTLHPDAQGHFDVVLSQERPANYTGDWWKLELNTQQLLLRQVASNWATERDPRISIERIDKPVERPRPPAEEFEKQLDRLGDQIEHSAFMLFNHVETLRKQGFINKLTVFDVSHMGGLVGQSYYEGAYDLKPDEVLIVEAKVPQGCTYWSIILTNDLYETTDWYNNQSSLNDSQARVDADGVVRYVVSAKDPGVLNWLDTAGYASGAIQGRWADCSSNPIPTVRKVDVSQVRASLPSDTPSVTPQDREKNIRERRLQLQQRPLW